MSSVEDISQILLKKLTESLISYKGFLTMASSWMSKNSETCSASVSDLGTTWLPGTLDSCLLIFGRKYNFSRFQEFLKSICVKYVCAASL